MEILSISVNGFRNISSAKLDFGNITALVGLNGYGKSNIMDAIDFAFEFIKATPSEKAILMASKRDIPILKVNAGRNFSFSLDVKLNSKKGSFFVRYEYSFMWKTDKSNSKIDSENLKIKRDEKNQKFNLFISRKNGEAQYKSSEMGRCCKPIQIEDDALILNKLSAIDDLFYSDIIKQINNVRFFVERHLDASTSYIPAPFLIRGFNELELEGIQSIPRAIFYLKRDYGNQFELLINAFKTLFPNIEDVIVREIKLNHREVEVSDDSPFVYTDSVFSMSVVDKNLIQPLSFEQLSDGTKRIFLMLTFAVIAETKGLSMIAIEEPENSIHPGLLQSYLDILSQLVNGAKIVITSHSPYIIQYLNPHNIYIVAKNDGGDSSFRRFSTSKSTMLLNDAAEYDKSIGDFIFDMLSSENSADSLQIYLE